MKQFQSKAAELFVALVAIGLIGAANHAVPPGASQAQPALGPMLPQFVVSARVPAFTLDSNCSLGGGAITFHLTVSNNGPVASPPIAQAQAGVMISTAMQTNGGPGSLWSVAAALPAIPAHGSIPVDVNLMPLSATPAMAGTHVFSAVVNAISHVKTSSTAGDATNISVSVPTGFCPNMTAANQAHTAITMNQQHPSLSPGSTQSATHNGGMTGSTSQTGAQPIVSAKAGPGNSKMAHVLPVFVQLPPKISAPANLQYTNDPSVCNAHAPGLAGALICPGLIASTAALPLVWDWQPCTTIQGSAWFNIPTTTVCGVSQPDGFHIYKVIDPVTSGSRFTYTRLGSRTLVDTQTDPSLTIRGISPYQKSDCYVVTAFKGSTESPDSNEWCGAPNLAMGTAWMEVNPVAGNQNGGTAIGCDILRVYGETVPWDPNNHEGIIKYDGQDNGTVPPWDCQGDLIYHATYKFDLSALKGITKVIFVAYFTQEKVGAGKDWVGVPQETSTTYPCAITGLLNAADSTSEIPLNGDTIGVTADITRYFAGNRVVTFGFAHKPDPDPGSADGTCLTAFKNVHIDVTYFP